jgi:hypothetical protein
MTFVSLLLIIFALALTGAVALVLAKLMEYREAERSHEDGDEFTPVKYAPMKRLLDPAEVAFLAEQPGTTSADLQDFKTARRRIFRSYLRELSGDFMALHSEARKLVAASPNRDPDLVEMVLRQQALFWITVARLEIQLGLDAVGLGSVDPRRLLDTVEALHIAMARATAVPGPVPVA